MELKQVKKGSVECRKEVYAVDIVKTSKNFDASGKKGKNKRILFKMHQNQSSLEENLREMSFGRNDFLNLFIDGRVIICCKVVHNFKDVYLRKV